MKCIVVEDDNVSRILIEKYIKKTKFLEIIGSFENPVDALNFDRLQEAELIFIDIEMPEMSGLDFMKSFKNMPLTVVISAKDKYAVESLNLDAIDYLMKPVEYSRFLKSAQKAKDLKNSSIKKEELGIFIKDGNTNLIRLKFDNIVWIEALENYVLFATTEDKYTVHFTMKSIETQLPENNFIRIHRSFIVNIDKIKSIEDNFIIINYNNKIKRFPIAKGMKDNLLKKIKIISK